MNEIEIYKSGDSEIEIRVQFENDTVWLSQKQMAELFEKVADTIGLHLKNIYSDEELEEKTTAEFFSVVQTEGKRQVNRKIKYYNLDAIISVGYRVNSKQGTQFRQWATQRLKDYLVKGYAINNKRLDQLQKVIKVIQQSGNTDNIQLSEAKGLLDILSNYTQSFILLNQYDSNNLSADKLNENISYEIHYEEAISAIEVLKKQLIAKKEATSLFGNQKDDSFKEHYKQWCKHLAGNTFTPALKSKRHISFISLLKITHSAMAINALEHLSLYGF